MQISTISATASSVIPTPSEEERAWRAHAEVQLAELRQSLALAQAQVEFQSCRLQTLLGLSPGSAVPDAQPRCYEPLHPVAAYTGAVSSELLALLTQNPNPVLRLTSAGAVCYANPAALTLEQALTQATQPFDCLLPLVRSALHQGVMQQQEVVLADKWYSLQAVPGDTCVTLYLTDSSAQHRAEQCLAEQREFYENTLNALPIDVVAFDSEFRFRFVNKSAIRRADIREWIIGKTDADYCEHRQLAPEIRAERQRHFDEACQARAVVEWEETIMAADGPRRVRRLFQPLFDSDGALRLMVGMGIDTTQRHQAEQKLVEQQAFYEFVLNQLPCDIGIFDNQYRYVFVNERGIRDPEVRKWIIGKDNFAYFERTNHPRHMGERRQAQFEYAVQERKLHTYEEVFARPDGARHLLRCVQPVFHPDGSLYLLVGYGLDITERVQAEQTLTQAKLAAEESVRVREAFLANMSHEIRTPMNAILGMSQLLAKTPLTDDQLNYQQAIATSAENLLVIINDVLDLSKLEAGKLVLEVIDFSPAHLLAQVEQTLRFKAAEKGLGLVTILSPEVPPVLLGDPYRLRQVLLNLADNALKFTQKGLVTVECLLLPPDADAPVGTAAVEFRVTDTGIGIEPEYIATMFTEFSQADSSVTRKFGGTGLGLSICRDLVRLMGSEMQVASQKSRGTTTQFAVHLPVGTTQVVERRKKPAITETQHQRLRGMRVLLVEDNLFNRQIAKFFLVQAEVLVTEAEHGAQAVELAQNQQFDLILMDVQMPVMDGYAATAILRQQLALPIPIIALTANAINGEREKCLAAGMSGYLAKPFQESQLLQQLLDWVPPADAAFTFTAPEPAVAALDRPAPSRYSIDDLLKAGQGDAEFVIFMLHTFTKSCEEAIRDLRRGLHEADLALLKGIAHSLKPSLQHLNAWQALPPVEKLDKWADAFDPALLLPLVEETEQQLGEVLAQIALDLKTDLVMTRVLAA